MFKDKTLVALGCSFTFGIFENDTCIKDPTTCHQRSWATKLGNIANFKEVVNLSIAGGSNYRSERVLIEYLRKNIKDIVVIFALTELSRFETVNTRGVSTGVKLEQGDGFFYSPEMITKVDDTNLSIGKKKFLDYYYGALHSDKADIEIINRKILMISVLLRSLNIEHYFLPMYCNPNYLQEQQLEFKIPIISCYSSIGTKISAVSWMNHRYTVGYCGHHDHDANQALAEHIYAEIKEIRNE